VGAGRFRRGVPAEDRTPASAPPGEALERAGEHAEVRAAFTRLSAPERQVLELRVIAGLSSEETAAVLGKQAGAVRTAQSRALAHLRELLGQSR
jgi:RNA polymerase sigma-70 factor (ECF subfamily)